MDNNEKKESLTVKNFLEDKLFPEKVTAVLNVILTLLVSYLTIKIVSLSTEDSSKFLTIIDDLKEVYDISNISKYFIYIYILFIAYLVYKFKFVSNDLKRLTTKPLLLGFIGFLLSSIGVYTVLYFFSSLEDAIENIGNNFANMLLGGKGGNIEDQFPSKITMYFGMLCLVLSLISFIMSLISFNKIIKNKDNISQLELETINAKKVFENSSDTAKSITEKIKKNKKSSIATALVILSISGFFIIKNMITPDAVIDLSNVKIVFSTPKGTSGEGTIDARVDYTTIKIKEEKDPKDINKKKDINRFINTAQVILDKDSNLKNGDKVTATLKFAESEKVAKDLKIKLAGKAEAKTEIFSLIEFITDFNEIKKDGYLESMEIKGLNSLKEINSVKDIEKIKTFTSKNKDGKITGLYFVYKFKYKGVFADDFKEQYTFSSVDDIYRSNGTLHFNSRLVSRLDFYDKEDDIKTIFSRRASENIEQVSN